MSELVALAEDSTCESCGKPADVALRDDSRWCLSCDASARNLGYDDEPIVAMREGLG